LRIVLDTNVLVSGLLNPDGNPGRVVDLFLAGEVTLLVDDRILAEYRAVLPRPKFGFDASSVSDLLDLIEAEGVRVTAQPLGIALPDARDLPFLEVAIAGEAEAIVTGNARHFKQSERFSVRVETPAVFVRHWPERRPTPTK
jgi:putative PIN family toxin of toxin-antitoxin system